MWLTQLDGECNCRAVPRATHHSSPLPSPPAPTLDLSDNEEGTGPARATPKVTLTWIIILIMLSGWFCWFSSHSACLTLRAKLSSQNYLVLVTMVKAGVPDFKSYKLSSLL